MDMAYIRNAHIATYVLYRGIDGAITIAIFLPLPVAWSKRLIISALTSFRPSEHISSIHSFRSRMIARSTTGWGIINCAQPRTRSFYVLCSSNFSTNSFVFYILYFRSYISFLLQSPLALVVSASVLLPTSHTLLPC